MKKSQPLVGKKILLGISGGIAAYKCAELTRRLIDQGAEVRIVMTASAKEFITPLTMQAVSGNPVSHTLLDPNAEAGMSHIELAKWSDLILIAPATANIIAKIRAGIADDLLSTICLATPSPIAISPAMNMLMYQAAATQDNLAALSARKTFIWGPAQGEQACGDVGLGRMLSPDELVELCVDFFTPKEQLFAGLNISITAGPTQEALDPVRYISNHSSGKMGYSIAQAAQEMGANVTLISGPVRLSPLKNVKTVNIMTANEMLAASLDSLGQCDIFIACAAVADYRPEVIATQKMKKQAGIDDLTIKLVKNPDVIACVTNTEKPPFCVGFAAETQHVEEYALKKLKTKKLNLIAANDVSKMGQGFNCDNNALTVYSTDDKFEIPFANKKEIAVQLLSIIATQNKITKLK